MRSGGLQPPREAGSFSCQFTGLRPLSPAFSLHAKRGALATNLCQMLNQPAVLLPQLVFFRFKGNEPLQLGL